MICIMIAFIVVLLFYIHQLFKLSKEFSMSQELKNVQDAVGKISADIGKAVEIIGVLTQANQTANAKIAELQAQIEALQSAPAAIDPAEVQTLADTLNTQSSIIEKVLS